MDRFSRTLLVTGRKTSRRTSLFKPPQLTGTNHPNGRFSSWLFLLLALIGLLAAMPVQADVGFSGSIKPSPQNNVPPNTRITYSFTVIGLGDIEFGGGFPQITILENRQNISSQFSSSACVLDGRFFCGTRLAGRKTRALDFSWTPQQPGTHSLTFLLTCTNSGIACTGAARTVTTIVAVPPTPPTADAGPDQTVTDTDNNGSEAVALNGNGSSDSDGEIASFQWLVGGKEIGSGVKPTVNLGVGKHTITLIVTDDDGLTDNDTVVITVNAGNTAPTANAGPNQAVTD
ncbi:MAG: hypothetical protein GY807_00730, partial [Gammaproteobacteria bacterium]|nr:hypothetical protein [Gammaproteobacteria bacterium]